MGNEFQKLSGEFQRTGKGALGSMVRSAADFRKSLQGVSLEWAEFSKKSVNQAIEAQAQLTKKAFDAYISEFSRFATVGLYIPFIARDETSEFGADGGQRGRRSGATNSRRISSSGRKHNKKMSSSRQRTAAQGASTHRKTGPAKARSRKRKG